MNAPLSHSGLFVGGEWIPARDSLDVLNPADGSRVGRCALGSEAELELAVSAARKAFATTRSLPGYERSAVLTRIAAGIEQRRDLFASLIVAEAGKPITFAEAEVNRAIHTFTAAAAESRETMGELLSMDAFNPGQGHSGLVRRFPIGVIYGMTPFNFPLNLVAHKVAPALASGNCIIVKPSPRTPLTALLLAEVIESAGATRGQVNVIVCSNEHAARLVGDPGVAMTSFTGSPAIGWALKARCGRQKLTLELGGNAAVVVHEDADLEAAVPLIATGAFGYAGQSCISVQRILVHEPVRERFQELLLSWTTSRVKMGDPIDRECMVGPMISEAAAARAEGLIQAARSEGARVLTGGRRRGAFLEPTLLDNVKASLDICRHEVFAPLAVLQSYRDFDEALAQVNDSDYGLQTGVFTRDIRRAWKAFETLEVGGVLLNNTPTFRVENMPYGGVKASGFGREGIRSAMEEMTEPRSLILKLG